MIEVDGGVGIEKQSELRINQDITAPEVRLINAEGKQIGVVSLAVALQQANDAAMDLVEISPDARPVVCKILDYGKYKYRESKKRQEARARQKHVEIKEIKFRLGTGEADYAVKLRNARRFLTNGDRVKVLVVLRGREITKQSLGRQRLEKMRDDLADISEVERGPVLEGNRLQMFFLSKGEDKNKSRDAGRKNNSSA